MLGGQYNTPGDGEISDIHTKVAPSGVSRLNRCDN
jgi:hypothetical protein